MLSLTHKLNISINTTPNKKKKNTQTCTYTQHVEGVMEAGREAESMLLGQASSGPLANRYVWCRDGQAHRHMKHKDSREDGFSCDFIS